MGRKKVCSDVYYFLLRLYGRFLFAIFRHLQSKIEKIFGFCSLELWYPGVVGHNHIKCKEQIMVSDCRKKENEIFLTSKRAAS